MCKKLPNLDKLQPKATLKDASTQSTQEADSSARPICTKKGGASKSQQSMVNSSVQVNIAETTSELKPDPHTLSELVEKVNNLEKTLKEHLTDLSNHFQTHNTQVRSAEVSSHHNNATCITKQSYAEALVGAGITHQSHHPTHKSPTQPLKSAPGSRPPNMHNTSHITIV